VQCTPNALRVQIEPSSGRNVGGLSLLNAITRQSSTVSSVAGTTVDPVEKPVEPLPLDHRTQ
jgi:tRNA U34 5-carboxymethylaminomethyl modifying GTPase MnmE/TrmE